MTNATEKAHIRKALSCILRGNASGLKKSIGEALLSKVRRALDKEEKTVAKKLIESATRADSNEPSSNS